MKNMNWKDLSFGYSKTDYNAVIIKTANGALRK